MKQTISLIGNLGGKPEMRYLPDGTAVTNFSLATNFKWGKGEERKEQVTWWRVSVFGAQAEACNTYLDKGRLVSVEGRMVPDPNTGSPRLFTRGDGTVGASFEVRASSVIFLGGASDAGSSPAGGGYVAADEEDEIPF
jgi:single-strand DNA-binding protein